MEIKEFLENNNIDFIKNASFKNYTTYGVGGKIKHLILPATHEELEKLLSYLKNTQFFVLGAGSKILPPDKKFNTPVIKLCGEFEGFEQAGPTELKVYSGVMVGKLLNYLKINGLTGLEFLCGIPASVGGLITMNAGTREAEIKNMVTSVEAYVFNGKNWTLKTFTNHECQFGYRTSVFKGQKCIIVSATFKVNKAEPITVINNCKQALLLRGNQPIGRSCGSVFVRLPDPNNLQSFVSAGKLIDECGLKGLKYKKAMVSPIHANFIINTGGAKSRHIKRLIKKCQKAVYNKFKATLKKEVIYLEG